MTKSGEKIGCQKVGDMALHHITSIRSAGISMYYTHTHSTAKHFSSKKKYHMYHNSLTFIKQIIFLNKIHTLYWMYFIRLLDFKDSC